MMNARSIHPYTRMTRHECENRWVSLYQHHVIRIDLKVNQTL